MSAFDHLVHEFINAEKIATRRFRWSGKRLDWIRTGTPEERRRFALLNIPRQLFSEASAATARRAGKPVLRQSGE